MTNPAGLVAPVTDSPSYAEVNRLISDTTGIATKLVKALETATVHQTMSVVDHVALTSILYDGQQIDAWCVKLANGVRSLTYVTREGLPLVHSGNINKLCEDGDSVSYYNAPVYHNWTYHTAGYRNSDPLWAQMLSLTKIRLEEALELLGRES